MIQASTLRPGLLVSLHTTVRGNVSYKRQDIEPEHVTEDGAKRAKWETEWRVSDPDEFEVAQMVRSKASQLVRSVCTPTNFGLICQQEKEAELEDAIKDARKLAEEFNSKATITHVAVYVMIGRVAQDDVEAVNAINSEVRGLMEKMEAGLKNLDVKAVRDAAMRAKRVGSMLSPSAQERVQVAVDVARESARKIVKAGEQVAAEIDNVTIRKIAEQRTAFLDLDQGTEIATPVATGRAVDFEPISETPAAAKAASPALELE